ncbi:PHA/PHB synthase family protein [Alkalilimnicola ehrlichii]|uniref:PHA/PHB synthase family protein n=1 Tax=Alkalilimnicola ehrlichii TaxID=351052 RepID=UPI003BA209EC
MANNKPTEHGALETSELSEALSEIATTSQKLVNDFLTKEQTEHHLSVEDALAMSKPFQEWAARAMADPVRLWQSQMAFWQDYATLMQNSALRFWGFQSDPVVSPPKGDRRFKSEHWEDNPLFDFIKQSYLLSADYLHRTVKETEGLDDRTAQKVDFYTRAFIDAMSPTNFVATNPEVLEKTLETRGQNLIKGLKNMLEDLSRGGGKLNIRMTDLDAFEVGENVATTPGKVVYQNDLIQLIQYQPQTEKVYKRPMLLTPAWINKYYIMDLSPKNSMVKWLLEQGHQVFMISWKNPTEKEADKTFEDYMLEGPLAAMDVVNEITGSRELSCVGYCLGGTLLACTLAYLAAKGDDRVKAATFLTCMLDFEYPGELEVFIDEEQIQMLERKMGAKGYLEGQQMATTFNMLRANDLIWSFFVNNYLKGDEPFPFDLLYWNSDATNMPAKMHSFYLRNMYQKNLLKEPGGITLAGEPIDLSQIKVPAYFMSAKEDHIAPWKSTLRGPRLLSGPTKYVLGGSGHIAGVINPPSRNKYGYWTSTKKTVDQDEWLESAKHFEGSWWNDWGKWLAHKGGAKVEAPQQLGSAQYPPIEDAPGSYVKERHDNPK